MDPPPADAPYRRRARREDGDPEAWPHLPKVVTARGTNLAVRLAEAPPPPEQRRLTLAVGGVFGAAGAVGLALGAGARALPALCFGGVAGVAALSRWWKGPRLRRARPIVELSHEPAERGDSVSLFVASKRFGSAAVSISLVAEEWCREIDATRPARARVVTQLLFEDPAGTGKGRDPWRTEAHFFVDHDAPPSFSGERFGIDWRIEVLFTYGDARFEYPFRVLARAEEPSPEGERAPSGEEAVSFAKTRFVPGDELVLRVRGAPGGVARATVLWRATASYANWKERPPRATPEEQEVHARELTFDAHGSADLRCPLPMLPTTYDGQLFTVEWLLRVEVEGRDPVHVPFVMA